MKNESPYKFGSLKELHQVLGLPEPIHPLVSLVDNMDIKIATDKLPELVMVSFYTILYKETTPGKYKYGQHYFDYDRGGLFFISPNQIIGSDEDNEGHTGYTLLIDPDFLRSYPLARKIKHYGFFSYTVSESLHLYDDEKERVLMVFKIIQAELSRKADDFSHDIIISQIELLLNYANRFYRRQFISRKAVSNELLQNLEDSLEAYYGSGKSVNQGVPTVHYLSEQLHLSPNYLSDLLRSLTGLSAQQHIHKNLIERAKDMLSGTMLSVSEIAYQLGFEHSQSFSKIFKMKTELSPLAFRKTFLHK